jgi:hypothetical protein
MRNNLFFILLIATIAILHSCGPRPTSDPVKRKIKQSIKKHDDNINGINLRVQNITIRENANFHYRPDGLLDSFDVYDDTLPGARLIKSLKLKYFSDRVRAFAHDTSGNVVLDFYFNSKNQITKMIDTLEFGNGFYFTYTNDKISNIKVDLNDVTYLNNFVYDANNNLIQYTITNTDSTPVTRVILEYDANKKIPMDLDIKFVSTGIRFLYAGGVNVFSLANLNYGTANTNRIIRRTEYDLPTNAQAFDYIINYTTNTNNEITNRKIVVNDSIDVFYEYRYQ